ncbi:DUF6261 family protein [Aquimarina spongiae]|uniref:Uncharacterized protein n=1 Tax=Aquimarina spongiae TaxID=570521 RepID=A0A1M6F396_9FLAO|nr:DUF6261 family protein [Aquimarina spongiae]SHI92151.1 hypothetical protein SAMN04488508_10470 [Aquimarina spongiae]
MFITPTFYRFRNSEFIEYLSEIQHIITINDPKTLQVVPQLIGLHDHLVRLEEVYKKQLGSSVTATHEFLDKRRDLAIIGIRIVTEGFTNHFEPAKRAAARVLLQSIDQYVDVIHQQNYYDKTNLIHKLTEDWEKITVLREGLDTLQILVWAQELKQSNISFEDLYLAHNTQFTNTSKINTIALINTAKDSFRQLINHLTAQSILEPQKIFSKVINEINMLTKKYNALVEKRVKVLLDVVDIPEKTNPN